MYQMDDLNKYVLSDLQRHLKLLRSDFKKLGRVFEQPATPVKPPGRKVAREDDSAPVGGTRPGDLESFAFGQFKTNAMLQIVRGARRGAANYTQVRHELHFLYTEMNARFHPLLGSPARDGEGWLKNFNALDQKLFLYNLAGEAHAPQASFLLIHYYGVRLTGRFGAVNDRIVTRWNNYWPNGAETDFGIFANSVNTLKTTSEELGKQALAAALACDAKQLCKGRDDLCALLVKLHDAYDEVVCRLNRLHLSPRYEPTFIEQSQRWLARAGYFVGGALRAWQTLAIPEKNLAAQLVEQWMLLGDEQTHLEKTIAHYARQQACPPPQLCQQQLLQVKQMTQAGLAHARLLQNDPTNGELRAQQAEHAVRMQQTLEQFRGKGVPSKAFNGYTWPLARIQWLLSCCQAEKEQCLLTDKQLEALLHKWQPQLADWGLNAEQCQGFARALQPASRWAATASSTSPCCEKHAAPATALPAQSTYTGRFQETLLEGERMRQQLPAQKRGQLDRVLQEVKQTLGALESGTQISTRQLERCLSQAQTALMLAERATTPVGTPMGSPKISPKISNDAKPRAQDAAHNAPFTSRDQARFAKEGVRS